MANELEFIGLDTQYPTADGQRLTRLHFDGAASPLAAKLAIDTASKLLPHYSNTHSYVHSSAQISSKAVAWAHQQILETLGADSDDYTAIALGSGTTAGINRVARGLAAARPHRKVVLVSAMEHHANDLPHRQFGNQVIYLPLTGEGALQGSIDPIVFEALCEQHAEQLNYVAFSSVSNVTGIRNPVAKLTEIAHRFGAFVLVDGAQQVAHQACEISKSNVDFFVFSGHKIYTPGSPGVLVAKKSILKDMAEQDLGGGSVSSVSHFDYQLLTEYPEREESGTTNIVGLVALAKVMQALGNYATVTAHNTQLMKALLKGLREIPNLTVYGDPTLPRIGALAFNHQQIDHGLLAAVLNDYYAVAVRNECFCAHPYVSSLIKQALWDLDLSEVPEIDQEAYINRKRGMVRISLSLYNSGDDVESLLANLKHAIDNVDHYLPLYEVQQDGSYRHLSYTLDWQSELDL